MLRSKAGSCALHLVAKQRGFKLLAKEQEKKSAGLLRLASQLKKNIRFFY